MMNKNSAVYSSMLRNGRNVYYIDVKEARNGKKYLAISETAEIDGKQVRQTVRVFGSQTCQSFLQAVVEAVSNIAEE